MEFYQYLYDSVYLSFPFTGMNPDFSLIFYLFGWDVAGFF